MSFVLPKLPYEAKELEPYTSATTLNTHYGKQIVPIDIGLGTDIVMP